MYRFSDVSALSVCQGVEQILPCRSRDLRQHSRWYRSGTKAPNGLPLALPWPGQAARNCLPGPSYAGVLSMGRPFVCAAIPAANRAAALFRVSTLQQIKKLCSFLGTSAGTRLESSSQILNGKKKTALRRMALQVGEAGSREAFTAS
jgi:hypothetical protein